MTDARPDDAVPDDAAPDGAVLARGALDWLLAVARADGTALTWATTPDDDEPDPTLYGGTAGIVLALLEGYRHFGDDRFAVAALRGTRAVAAAADREWESSSLYTGLAGMAFALRSAAQMLGEPAADLAAGRALDLVRGRFDGQRWSSQFELLGGNAGIALGAAAAGDLDLAVLAVTPYLATAEPTPGGVHWEVRAGLASRFHHISHGTLGIVYALAAIGHATGRGDLGELALAGAADVISRNEAGPDGFLVPHSDPQSTSGRTARYNYGWCHGPAGDAQVFRLLASVTGDPAWTSLADRCWHTVTHSGLPTRLYPGFWDNSGRCCGTAGVLALACDREVEQAGGLAFADVLAADLAARATVDAQGARWSNCEHRATPPTLVPRPGWAMGNAGIIRELLHYARIHDGRDPGYAVTWPDHLPAAARERRAEEAGGQAGSTS
ncbi:MAG TPA: lanthionine synthetase LanC family protein [Streptosporangiaceae bacterium]|nr:lanthionine synthetase LanC family protein [Streptosporangiaceae bacterium]